MLKKLRSRFIIITMSLISIALIITFSALIISSSNRMTRDSLRSLEINYMRLNSPLKPDKLNNIADNIPSDAKNKSFDGPSPFSTFFISLDSNDSIVMISDFSRELTDEVIEKSLLEALEQDKSEGLIHGLSLRYTVFEQVADQRVIGFIDISYEKSFIRQQIINYSLIGVGSLAVFFLISLVLSGIAIRPIEKAWKQQQQFVADASHELKTPITVMLANTSILLSNKFYDKKLAHKWISYIDLEAKRMKKLVENLLLLARLDTDKTSCNLSKLCLSDIVSESTLPFEAMMFETSKQLNSNIQSDLYIHGNDGQLKQLICILLDNANKYANSHSTVTVHLKKENNKAILSVNSFGELIAKHDLIHVFDRFFQSDKARSKNQNSYGLGLSIAKEIVAAHKGKISVSSEAEKGTTFIVYLPM